MTLNEYQVLAARTLPLELIKLHVETDSNVAAMIQKKYNLSHMVIGLASEGSELEDAIVTHNKINMGEELGDKAWYLAGICTIMNWKLEELKIYSSSVHTELFHIESLICNNVKRYMAYDKEDSEKLKNLITKYIAAMISFCKHFQLDFEVVLEKNIKKLQIRYKDRYTDEEAITRDLDAELNALS